MTINLSPPATHELKPKILVFGVGGAGCNAVNNMVTSHLEGVEFVVANTDAQSLEHSLTERRIQLGANITQGLGAGARPDIGRQSAEEALESIKEHLESANMVFITCGMGGGTGTGAAPVVAQAAREAGILTIGVATKPFHFEGKQRMGIAEAGLAELQQVVDTLIVIPNQNLFRVASAQTTFADAFKMADDVLYSGVRGVTDLMVMPGLINLDFADVRSVMREMGKAMMGTGEAEGEERAKDAAEAAVNNPLLDDVSLTGARGVLVNITGGPDMTLFEVDDACRRIRDQVDERANIIFGSTFDESLAGRIRVSVVATGIDEEGVEDAQAAPEAEEAAPRPAVYAPAPETAMAGVSAATPGLPPRPRSAESAFDPPEPRAPAAEPRTPDPAPALDPAAPDLAARRDGGRVPPDPFASERAAAPVLETPPPPPPPHPAAAAPAETKTRPRVYDWLKRPGRAPADADAGPPAAAVEVPPRPPEPAPPAPMKSEPSAFEEQLDDIPPFLRRSRSER